MLGELGGGLGFSDRGLSVRQTATAYDIVKAVRQMIAGQWAELEKVWKDAALVVREVLVLQCIAAASSKSPRASMQPSLYIWPGYQGRDTFPDAFVSQQHFPARKRQG